MSQHIGEKYTNEDGQEVRIVNGKETIQIVEDTEKARSLNAAINAWRCR